MQDVITINNYAEFEQKFDNVMQETAEKFVVIGYMLKVARDTDILRESGYTTMGEFAQKRYGLTKDIASRYIAINDRYSEGGYSEQLDPKYKMFGYAKLAEMLTLPDSIVEEISPEMTREDIRGIKGEVAEEKNISDIEVMLEEKDQRAEANETLIGKAIYQICREHPDIFRKLWVAVNEEIADIENLMDILAPSGIAMLSCRIPGTGRMMLSVKGIDENLQIVNLRSNEKEEVTWGELQGTVIDFLFTHMGTVRSKWENIYAEEFPEEKPKVAPAQPKSERVVKSVKPETHKETPKKEAIKDEPAAPEEQLPGQMEVADYPEMMPENPLGKVIESVEREAFAVAAKEKRDEFNNGNTGRNIESISEDGESGKADDEGSGISANEPKTTQSNGENKSTESEEYKTLKEETEELAHGVYDVFWGWSDDKIIPKGELQMALKNAKKLVMAIEKLIEMTGEQ